MIEPKTGLEVGVWFEKEDVHSYVGNNSLVVELERILPTQFPSQKRKTTDIVILRSPPSKGSFIKVLRWLILPP